MDLGEPQPMQAEWGQSKTILISIFRVVYAGALTLRDIRKRSKFGRKRRSLAFDRLA
jgi:hypothetical protein